MLTVVCDLIVNNHTAIQLPVLSMLSFFFKLQSNPCTPTEETETRENIHHWKRVIIQIILIIQLKIYVLHRF